MTIRNPEYRLFQLPFIAITLGQVISRVGDSVYEIGLLWLVFERTGSALATGVMLACETLPALIFTLLGGVLADRLNRRQAIFYLDVARSIIPLGLGVAVVHGLFNLPVLYVLTFILGTLTQLHNPSLQALFPSTVREQDLARANAVFRIAEQGARIVGPILGGLLVAAGPAWIFFANALSFWVAAVFALGIPRQLGATHQESSGMTPHHLWNSAAEGLHYVWRERTLLLLIIMGVLLTVGFGPINVAVPALVASTLGLGSAAYGRAASGVAIGMLGGAITAAMGSRFSAGLRTIRFAVLGVGLAFLTIGFVPTFSALFWCGMAAGFCIMFSVITGTTLLQESVPMEMRGRVFAVMELLISALTPLSLVAGGLLLQAWRPEQVIALVGAFMLMSGAASLLPSLGLGRGRPSDHQA